MNYLNIYIDPHLFGFPSHLGHYRALNRVSVLYSMFSLVIYFIHSITSVYTSIPISQLIPTTSLSPYTYVCCLQMCSSCCRQTVGRYDLHSRISTLVAPMRFISWCNTFFITVTWTNEWIIGWKFLRSLDVPTLSLVF